MTVLEVILIVIGLIFILASFMITEKLSPRDVEHLSQLSKDEINEMVSKGLEKAQTRIDEAIDDQVEEVVDKVEREMEKESNRKVMLIQEYSDGVLESIHKTHEEVMFLYGMLSDKQEELKESVSEASVIQSKIQKAEDEPRANKGNFPPETQIEETHQTPPNKPNVGFRSAASLNQDEQRILLSDVFTEPEADLKTAPSETDNHNDKVLELHKKGFSEVDIAKELGLGRGEVRLVLDLYKGAK